MALVVTRILAVLLCVISVLSARAADPSSSRPNIVFIIADDLTYRDLGCYGGQAHTPNIDRLAEQGMQFSHCFQSAPMCSPTRHNIYTGLYPVKSGAYPNHTFVQDGTPSIVHYLRPLGYRVALSGKTHIGPKESFPFEYSAQDNNPDMQAVAKLFAECSASNTPFCLFACSNEPHSPWNKGDASRYPADKVELPAYIADTPVVRENFSRYLAEISYYDDQVGQIVDLLDRHNLSANTLLMVVSEQGNSFPFAKWTCYDQGLQSAMIVRWPGTIQAGSQTDAIVEYTDICPTFVAAAGGEPSATLDGKSFLNVLTGRTNEHKQYTFGEMTTRGIINGSDAYAIRSVRNRQYRLIWNLNHESEFTNACTSSDYFASMVRAAEKGDSHAEQLVNKYRFRPELELYDCVADPDQMNNLAEDPGYSDVLQSLMAELKDWMQSQGDLGLDTEMAALQRQMRYRNMSREQADAAWQARKKK
ncbi:MAG: sulfatase [bacterium]|nr:sulfatase [bacterium]